MSALSPKADMCGATRHVRFGPKADIRTKPEISYSMTSSAWARSDGGKVSPSALAVLRQFELCRRLYGQVGRSFAFEDAIDVTSRSSERIDRIRSVRDQAAFGGEVAERIDGGQSMPGCKVDDQFTVRDRCRVRCQTP
jgi:hypothetical protein